MAQNYTQKRKTSAGWEELHPRTSAAQVVTDEAHQFVTAAEKIVYAGKQDALGFSPENAANKNQPGGYAGLDANGKLDSALVPDTLVHDKGYYADEQSLAAAYPTASAGDFATVGSTDTIWIWDADKNPAGWIDSAFRGSVVSVNGKTGDVVIEWADLSAPDASAAEKGVVQLSSATNSTSETLAATPKAVKAVMDAANARAKISVSVTAPTSPAEGDFWFDTSTT